MANVLITGGAGFIGSHLADALVARGDQVRIFDNFSSGKLENLSGVNDKIKIIEGDIRKPNELKPALEGIEVVYHQAAMVSVPESIQEPEKCFDINVQGVINLLALALEENVQKVVLASSTAVYGAQDRIPLREDYSVQTLSPYAASKHFNESLATVYSENYGLDTVALRYFNVYGKRQSPSSDYAAVIPKFIESLKNNSAPIVYGDGSQTRDFIYVGDVVRANILAADSKMAGGKAINICSGKEQSLLNLLEMLYKFFPDAPKAEFSDPRIGDVPRSSGESELAKKMLGFSAETSLDDGLKQMLQVSN